MPYKVTGGDERPEVDAKLVIMARNLEGYVINVVHIGDIKTGEGGGAHVMIATHLPRIGEILTGNDRVIGRVRAVQHAVVPVKLPSGKAAQMLMPNVVLEHVDPKPPNRSEAPDT